MYVLLVIWLTDAKILNCHSPYFRYMSQELQNTRKYRTKGENFCLWRGGPWGLCVKPSESLPPRCIYNRNFQIFIIKILKNNVVEILQKCRKQVEHAQNQMVFIFIYFKFRYYIFYNTKFQHLFGPEKYVFEFMDKFNGIFTQSDEIDLHHFRDVLQSIIAMDNEQYIDMLKLLRTLFVRFIPESVIIIIKNL